MVTSNMNLAESADVEGTDGDRGSSFWPNTEVLNQLGAELIMVRYRPQISSS
jgi:hypothetical protein